MDKYTEMLEKSKKTHTAKKRKLVIVDREQFQFAVQITATIVIAITALSIYSHTFLSQQQLKTNMQAKATSEFAQHGFQVSINDTRYYLLEDADLFDVFVTLPTEGFNKVLTERGYTSLEDFYSKNGYENFDEWKEASIEKFKEEQAEERSKSKWVIKWVN